MREKPPLICPLSQGECPSPVYCNATAIAGAENFSGPIPNVSDSVRIANATNFCAGERLAALVVLEVSSAISDPEVAEQARQRASQIERAREAAK